MLNFLYEIEFNSDELYDNTIDYTDNSTNKFDTSMKSQYLQLCKSIFKHHPT